MKNISKPKLLGATAEIQAQYDAVWPQIKERAESLSDAFPEVVLAPLLGAEGMFWLHPEKITSDGIPPFVLVYTDGKSTMPDRVPIPEHINGNAVLRYAWDVLCMYDACYVSHCWITVADQL